MIPALIYICLYADFFFFFFSSILKLFNQYKTKRLKSFPVQKSQIVLIFWVNEAQVDGFEEMASNIRHGVLFNIFSIKTDKHGFEICFFCSRSVVIKLDPWFQIKCLTIEPNDARSGVELVITSAVWNRLADSVNLFKRFYCVPIVFMPRCLRKPSEPRNIYDFGCKYWSVSVGKWITTFLVLSWF